MKLLEICIDSFESALRAAKSGAHRLELCQDLSVGGLTPTPGFVTVIKKLVTIPVFVLIRPRPGDFLYNRNEVEQMQEDIRIIMQCGADGLVFGALDKDNCVDFSVCQQLLAAARPLPVTFHRAFDQIFDKTKELETIISLGFQRILTSGDSEIALESTQTLQNLVSQANSSITIMPGGSINDHNILHIVQSTGATEFHSSGRKADPVSCTQKSQFCSEEVVHNMRQILDQLQ